MKILITGANGLLGEKCALLLAQTYNVLATDIDEKSLYSDQIPYQQLDITRKEDVIQKVRGFLPDVVVNCAGYTDVDGSEKNRELAWSINVEGVRHLVNALNPIGGYLIHFSSDYIFDGSSGPYREDSEPKPVNFYGETKLASEEVVKKSQGAWTIIRSNVLFGNSVNQKSSFVFWVIDKLQRREKIRVVNDQFGNPTWIRGLAEAVLAIVKGRLQGIYNYGGADYINRFEFALEIAAVYAYDPTLILASTTRALGQVAARPFKAGLVVDKIKNELGVKIYSIKEALTIMKGTG